MTRFANVNRPRVIGGKQIDRFGSHRRDQGDLVVGLSELLWRQAHQIHQRVSSCFVKEITQAQTTVPPGHCLESVRDDDA